jgi:hypothetical protein
VAIAGRLIQDREQTIIETHRFLTSRRTG